MPPVYHIIAVHPKAPPSCVLPSSSSSSPSSTTCLHSVSISSSSSSSSLSVPAPLLAPVYVSADVESAPEFASAESSSWMLDKATELPAVRSEDLLVSNSSNSNMAPVAPSVPPCPEFRPKQPPPPPKWPPPLPMRRPLRAMNPPIVPERPLGIAKYSPMPSSQTPQ